MFSLLLVAITSGLAYVLWVRYRSALRKIPGPWLASITNFHLLYTCATGSQMAIHLQMHKKYGPLVRIGPSCVSVSDGSLIPQLYGTSTTFTKSSFYEPFDVALGMPTIFSTRNDGQHKAMKKQLGAAFSMSSMRELEPQCDECSAILLSKLQTKADNGQTFDLATWMHWYSFDVISSVTFSSRLGFVEQERDIDSINHALYTRLQYLSIVGQMPWLHRFMLGNAIFGPLLAKIDTTNRIVEFAMAQFARYQEKHETSDGEAKGGKDILSRLKNNASSSASGDGGMNDADVLTHALTNIFAGSDTTGITLTALFYHLLRSSTTNAGSQSPYATLRAEVDAADAAGQLSDPVTFAQAQRLPYLQACIKEALRLHPAVGLLLERVAPAGGAQLGSEVWVPEGTIVGMNPWVAARDRDVYGCDADAFRPERWAEADEERMRLMERNFLAFGAGSRSCTGKAISLLEISKIVPQLLRRLDFELVGPQKEWKLHDYFFVWQNGTDCRVRSRG